MEAIDVIEMKRLMLQSQLDSMKTQAERNKLGQFATPTELANDILAYAQSLIAPGLQVRFLDPAVGTGSFFAALLKVFPFEQIASATGYEIDRAYANEASKLWNEENLKIYHADFTRSFPPVSDDVKSNLLVCNPPYVRHHHLSKEEKERLYNSVETVTNIKLSKQSGLYCHFLCLSHLWLAEGGLAGWLIPGEFLDVNYGEQIRKYLQEQVTLLRIHRFDPKKAQFSDALVSSAVVWFRRAKPATGHEVEFTFGGTLQKPHLSKLVPNCMLDPKEKWSKLSLESTNHMQLSVSETGPSASSTVTLFDGFDFAQKNNSHEKMSFTDFPTAVPAEAQRKKTLADLFRVKRGLATGANEYFILNEQQIAENRIPAQFLTPILPNPRIFPFDEVMTDSRGFPLVENRQFLLTCNLPEEEVQVRYPSLWNYLQKGVKAGISEGYLCRHRDPWYSQENRPPSMFLCTYMGRQDSKRGKPFRFILNHSAATATNVYHMLYPKPYLQKALEEKPQLVPLIWQALQAISPELLIHEGRVYGGGLHKMEPRELANVPADAIFALLRKISVPIPF